MALKLEALRGRILDTDSHEMIPAPRWGEVFGERGARFAESANDLIQVTEQTAQSESFHIARRYEDDKVISPESVWGVRGFDAPSAIDINRREATLDEMGISRALIFPGMGILAWVEAHGGGFGGMPLATPERIKVGFEALEAFNDWAIEHKTDRLRIPGILTAGKPGTTPEDLIKNAGKMIKAGLKVIHIGTGHPPAGVGFADAALDKFYATLAEANVSLVTHPPAGWRIMSEEWNRAAPGMTFAVNHHMGEEQLVGQMALGGVFERHPTLRVGCIESGADWIGPLAERLDISLDSQVGGGMTWPFPLKPSEYINRNVRVSVLAHEPVERWLKRYPEVQNVYCYSSDFPHSEGQVWSLKKFYERVAPLGDEIVENFFCKNAQLLMP